MCMFDPGDDSPSVYRETMVTARKQHRCGECGRDISPGERYQYVFGVWDNQSGSYRTCAHCRIAQRWLQSNCDGWLFGCVLEDIQEHALGMGVFNHRDGYGSEPARLVVGMRRKWQRFDGIGLMGVL